MSQGIGFQPCPCTKDIMTKVEDLVTAKEGTTNEALLVSFDIFNLCSLFFNWHLGMDNPDATLQSHRYGHSGFRDSVHGAGCNWSLQRDRFREAGE